MFVLDWDKDTSWANWKPSIIPEEADGDIDDSSVNVSFAGEGRKDNKGYMWADLDTLLSFTNQPNSSSVSHLTTYWAHEFTQVSFLSSLIMLC